MKLGVAGQATVTVPPCCGRPCGAEDPEDPVDAPEQAATARGRTKTAAATAIRRLMRMPVFSFVS
jgi:hypothetical protein